MKNITKILALLVSLTIILSLLSSCSLSDGGESTPNVSESTPDASSSESTPTGSQSTPEESSPVGSESSSAESHPDSTPESTLDSTPGSAPESTPEETEDDSYLINLLPPKMELDREMNILAEILYEDEWLDSDNGETVGSELFKRVGRTEEHLGIELNVTKAERKTFLELAEKHIASADPSEVKDLISAYSIHIGSLTLQGSFRELSGNDYLDLTNPWWPEEFTKSISVDDKLYFVTGDVSPTLFYETFAVFYNRGLVDKYAVGDPLEMVEKDEWTLDRLIEITSGIYSDADGSKSANLGDFFALTLNDKTHVEAMAYGMGVRVLKEAEGTYTLTEEFTQNKMAIIAEKINLWFAANDGVMISSGNYGGSFAQGESIFDVGNFYYALIELKGKGIDYGVLPLPLFDVGQDEYISYYGSSTSFWGIPKNAEPESAAKLLEYLGADGYAYITPAIYREAAEMQTTKENAESVREMMKLIRSTLVFDPVKFYKTNLSGIPEITSFVGSTKDWRENFSSSFTVKTILQSCQKLYNDLRYLN